MNGRGHDEQFELILRHECQHTKQRHVWDLAAINLVSIFLWFNPFVWLLWRELVSVHEFSADRHRRQNNKRVDLQQALPLGQ